MIDTERSYTSGVAQQIIRNRQYERLVEQRVPGTQGYEVNRDGYRYLETLGGVQFVFEYVRSLGKADRPALVVDVGTGNGRGWNGLATTSFGEGLRFEATALRLSQLLRSVMAEGNVKVHLTSAEKMRGYSAESIGLISSVYGLTYAEDQAKVAHKQFQLLVPGGVIKATFPFVGGYLQAPDNKKEARPHMNSWQLFVSALRELGCDTDVIHSAHDGGMIVLAIKPGNPQAPSARELLRKDFDSIDDQEHQMSAARFG